MSVPTTSPEPRPRLSAGVPFENLLSDMQRSSAAGRRDTGGGESFDAAGLPPTHPVRKQKGLSKADATGLKNVQNSLTTNRGGLPSGIAGERLFGVSLAEAHKNTLGGVSLGVPSSKHPITRAATLPDRTSDMTADTLTAVTVSVAQERETPVLDNAAATPERSPPLSPSPTAPVSAADHFGMTPYVPIEPGKPETALQIGKRLLKNFDVLMDASRIQESKVDVLELTVDRLAIEFRLRPNSPIQNDLPSHSPSASRAPTPDEESPDLDDLLDITEDTLAQAREAGDAAVARIAVLEKRSEVRTGTLTVAALSELVITRFGEVTRHHHSPQTGVIGPASCALPDSPTSGYEPPLAMLYRLPTRSRVLHGREVFVTVGPLSHSDMSPLELFESLISDTLPTFTFTGPYSVEADPKFEYHIRATLDSGKDADALLAAWNTGRRKVGMPAFTATHRQLERRSGKRRFFSYCTRSQSAGTSGSAAAGATDPSAGLGALIDPINDLLAGGAGGASPLPTHGAESLAGLREAQCPPAEMLLLDYPSAGLGSLIDRIKNLLEQLTGGAGGGSPLSALTGGGKSGRAASGPGAGLGRLATLLQRLLQQLSGNLGGGAASL
ncbi:hypothetical protein C8R43DRAFT_1241073 [Mycena crocata]|nr:hypothetical protein C8R43DRAFT_1241073 [Mycena crocata]